MPTKVAIIGGGCAAMATAFELTRPHLEGEFDVTVYQMGWRLGGKGASGRGVAGRIEEHGLHLWMGFYENAFRLMRECYAELDRDPAKSPIADWRDAFEPAPLVGVADRVPGGEWEIWRGALPPTAGMPGDPGSKRWTVADYMNRTVGLVLNLLRTIQETDEPAADATGSRASTPFDLRSSASISDAIAALFRYGEIASLAALVQAVNLLAMVIGNLDRYADNVVLGILDQVDEGARVQLEKRLAEDVRVRRVWHVLDLSLATLRGIVRFGIATHAQGFDAIDDYDCREWLLLCGASKEAVDSGWVRALYDLGFSYEDANVDKPSIAAGQALRSMLRAFFTYRGSFFWRMNGGMGDIVFAPFFEVLHKRGVRFEFFHRLRNVRLAKHGTGTSGESHVVALEIERQAKVKGGGTYEPLVDVGGLPCWPSRPLYDQLEAAQALRERDLESHWDEGGDSVVLEVEKDFDFVVLGIGLGAVAGVTRELVDWSPRWKAMVQNVRTVPTQAFQIWMKADMAELGWPWQPVNVSGFVEPFDTWADMSHLIPRESWPGPPPRSIAYFCSVLDEEDVGVPPADGGYPEASAERVRRNAIRFLERDVHHLWPNSWRRASGFRWDLLVDADSRAGRAGGESSARFNSQFWTANVNPSDRYVLSLPGTSAYRISPLERILDNLTVAGDWTSCGFNAGCVEAAIMSGRLAAHALAQSPPLEEIVGYDHP